MLSSLRCIWMKHDEMREYLNPLTRPGKEWMEAGENHMGIVYFVRHGQTVWNRENKICGITDSPLTELGHQQAMETGRRILEEGIRADVILHSPLQRARDTAGHISDLTGIPLREEPRLIEQNFGFWESTPKDSEGFLRARGSFVTRFGNGESMMQLAQRIYNLLDELREESDRKTCILVAHNGLARVVNSYFYDMTNEEYAAFGINNCEIRRYEF
mgnify:CR=1 FL=1